MPPKSVILPDLSSPKAAVLPDASHLFYGHPTGVKLKEILARVESRLVATGQTADGASRAAGKPDAIRNMKRAVKAGRRGVNSGTIAALAPILKTTAAWLLDGEGQEEVGDTVNDINPKRPRPGNSVAGQRKVVVNVRNRTEGESLTQIPGSQLIGERDLPVFGTSQGGKGAVILSSDPVDWVARPEPLARVKDGYGIIITEDSMAPEFRSGDTALVNPHLPARAGDTCIFRGQRRDGTILSCIKFLRRQTADAWHVTEWNSDDGRKRDFTLKKSEWQKAEVTVGKYSRS